MSAPFPIVSINGMAVVPADLLNTYVQTVVNFAQLRTFTGLSGMLVEVQGGAAPGDGLGGTFYYSAASTAADNGSTVIVPLGAIQGAWVKLTPVYTLLAPLTGFSVQVGPGVTALFLNPAGTLATGTVIFPQSPIDGQLLTISTSQIITAISLVAPAGQTILGLFTSIGAAGHASWRYVAPLKTWFRTD